jgi:flagellar assembly protein FliH
MMNTSSNSAGNRSPIPIGSLMYRDLGRSSSLVDEMDLADTDSSHETAPQDVASLIEIARTEAIAETETRMKNQCRAGSEEEAAKIACTIERFHQERKEYFARVESDVVHLALTIAAKILHREAQVDALLIAGLVRVAIDKLHDGSSVSIRVCSAEVEKWKQYLAKPLNGSSVQIVADDHLGAKDCFLETDLGSANFSIDAQLKEIEQGFFDLLAQRPAA